MKEVLLHKVDSLRENLFTATTDEHRPVTSLTKRIFDPKVRKGLRFQAGISLLTHPFERRGWDIKRRISNHFIDTDTMPFSNRETTLLGYGWESFVFPLRTDSPQVLKVDRESLGLPPTQQVERALYLQRDYEQILAWHGDIDGFVTPSSFIIGELAYRGLPAVGIIQPKIESYKGIFEDFTESDLLILLRTKPELGRKFIKMASKIFDTMEQYGGFIDFVGEKNICISETATDSQLVLLDSCSIKTVEGMSGESSINLFSSRTKKLHSLLEKLKANDTFTLESVRQPEG
ncbi:MAG: hypothetical protein AAB553_04120 [Patescibacteria group bacterium]